MSETTLVKTPGKHGWTYQGVFIILWVSLSLAMLADVFINRKVDLLSNVTLLITSCVAGWKVRTNDYQAAIWAPALVWFVTLMTVGQFAPKRGGSFLREEVLHIAYGLSAHAGWILGATILSGAIAIVRRGRNL
ncbi:MAG: hypothetical protein RLZZ571_24 [Actinomycetota bacterium]|jgi:hypothetical protein